jgi:hypothetical protein
MRAERWETLRTQLIELELLPAEFEAADAAFTTQFLEK